AAALIFGGACNSALGQDKNSASDAAQIYRAFLNTWVGEEKEPLNISESTKAPSEDQLKDIADCTDIAAANWTPQESDDLRALIGDLSYVRLVDPKRWSPRDPGDLIAQGQAVDSAVKQGFSSGL